MGEYSKAYKGIRRIEISFFKILVTYAPNDKEVTPYLSTTLQRYWCATLASFNKFVIGKWLNHVDNTC